MHILMIVGRCPFPYGAAWSSRARHFAKLFMECGHSVHVMSYYTYEKNVQKNEIISFEGYTYQALKTKVAFTDRFTLGKECNKRVKEYISVHSTDVIFTNNCPDRFEGLMKISKKFGIPVFLEQCEWYDPSGYKIGKFDPYYRSNMRHIASKYQTVDGIVAISRLFENYYGEKGVKTIRIPTILDKNATNVHTHKLNERKKLVLAGKLGRSKELIGPIVQALSKDKSLQKSISVDLYGSTMDEVLLNMGDIAYDKAVFDGCITAHGKIPQLECEEKVANADFTIFIRPYRRSSNAGFPTKFAESMLVGTPVITNNTGDISLYLKDGVNGFLLGDISPDVVVATLQKISTLSDEEYQEMRAAARKTAEENFDYRNYIDMINELLKA